MRRLELRLLFFALDWHLAGQWLLRVLLVVGERSNRLVITPLSWVCWLKGLIVLDERSSLGLGCAMWDLRVLLKNLSICVERVRLFSPLGERLILHHGLRVFALSLREILGPVVVVLHVRDSSTESDLLAHLALFNRICANVRW